jgi:hypothetical protein
VAPLLYAPWITLLRKRLRRAGVVVNDHLLGLFFTGGMTEARILRLLEALPAGVTELYSHPAVAQTPALARSMPDYRPAEEFAALLSPAIRRRIESAGIGLVGYGDIRG